MAAPTTFLRRDESDRTDKHRPSGSNPMSGQGDGSLVVLLEGLRFHTLLIFGTEIRARIEPLFSLWSPLHVNASQKNPVNLNTIWRWLKSLGILPPPVLGCFSSHFLWLRQNGIF